MDAFLRIRLSLLLLLAACAGQGQVGIGTTAPDARPADAPGQLDAAPPGSPTTSQRLFLIPSACAGSCTSLSAWAGTLLPTLFEQAVS